MRKLITVPNDKNCHLLRKKCEPVKEIDSKVKSLAREMGQFMIASRAKKLRPAGLAAPQLGELVRVFAFYKNPLTEDEDIEYIINPELAYEKGSRIIYESCLSIPGRTFLVKRAKLVKIRGWTLDGAIRSFRGHDLLAQVFQHELNHLDGILIDTIGEEGPNA
jgi:peptide deformylase